MKIVLAVFTLFLLNKECNQNKNSEHLENEPKTSVEKIDTVNQQEDSMTITYEVQSRGVYDKIWVTKDSIATTKDRSLKRINSVVCSDTDWKTLSSTISKIALHQLHELDVPSKAHQYDGAPMATLKIMSDDVIYSSPIFDHGNPPEQLTEVVNKLLALQKIAQKQ